MTNALGGVLGVQQYVLLFLWGVLLWGVCREVRDFIGMPRRGRARRPRWREAKLPVACPGVAGDEARRSRWGVLPKGKGKALSNP